MKLITSTFFLIGLSLPAVAAEPEFDCNATETAMYIKQVSHGLYSPSPIPTPEEFKKAFIEQQTAAAANGDPDAQSCVTIFGDGSLSDEWKKAIEAIRNIDINIDFSGINAAALKKILEEAKKKVQEEVTKAIAKLGEDICNMLSTDNVKGIVLDGVNEKYGINARHLRMKDFANEAKDEMMDNAPENVQLLIDKDEIPDMVGDATRDKLRRTRKDLWDGF